MLWKKNADSWKISRVISEAPKIDKMLNPLTQDARHAVRLLAKQPIFTTIVVLTLALGIGANTAIFSVVNAVLLRPLSFPRPNELVEIGATDTREKAVSATDLGSVSYPDFVDWRSQNSVFSGMAVYNSQSFTLTANGEAAHAVGAVVSADLFHLLGVPPNLGRAFVAREDEPGAHVVILSHELWQRRFGGNRSVLGQNIMLDGKEFQVVGVMPAGFQFPVQNTPTELWTTIAIDRETSAPNETPMTAQRGNQFLNAIGRLKPGVELKQAQANLATIAAALAKQYPESNLHTGVRVESLLATVVGDVRPALWMLFGAAGCVLLVACVNVANLLVARSMARQKEMSIRAALGAGRGQIVRQLLTESIVLALLGGAAGVLLAVWGIDSLAAFLPQGFPRLGQIALDGRVLFFALGISLLVGALAGVAPGLRASQQDLISSLNETGRGSTESGRGRRLRGSLVVLEIVLALVLLSGAGLLLQSFVRLGEVHRGFDSRNVLTARITLPDGRYPKPAQAAQFYRGVIERAAALPGVRAATAAWRLPLSGSEVILDFDIEAHPMPKGHQPVTEVDAVALNYFRTLQIPLLRGRDFNARDDHDAPPVAIVSESFAKQFFPNEDPIGKRIKPAGSVEPGEPPMREIVGVVGDTRVLSLREGPKPEVYLPHAQFGVPGMALLVRGERDPNLLLPALRAVVRQVDPEVPLYSVHTLDDYVAASIAQPRFNAALVVLFAAVALLLAAAGIYGVMSYSVTQRTQEIGIRLALGAQRSDVVGLIVGEGARLVALGVTLGLAVTFVFTRSLQGLLFGIGATHLPTLGAVTLLLALVALLACWWPARRASGVDPIVALREG